MSSILKALKKLENEKAANTTERLNIDKDILLSSPAPKNRYRLTILFAVIFFILGISTKYFKTTSIADKKVNAATETAQVSKLKELPPASNSSIQNQPKETPVQSTVSITPKPSPTPPNLPETLKKRAKPEPTQEDTTSVKVATPKLTVDGIAYHMGSTESLAVVNGVAVYVGTTVEGVKVEEIAKDRIRFSHAGKSFEVLLGKSN